MTLIEEIYSLYDRYKPEEIAAAIAQYRSEVIIGKEVQEIDAKIIELKTRRRKLLPKDFAPD